jgi:Raf kinase inhibitor-like YbhB/YbcL family protein
MLLSSPAFAPRGEIPRRHTCDGEDLAPALRWSAVPEPARSLVLIVDDPDAPDPAAPQCTWVHWLVYDIPPDSPGLPEGGRPLPRGAREGLNDWRRRGWGGPCPPIGRHRYYFRLHALDTTLAGLADSLDRATLEAHMRGHVLASAELVGTFERAHR